MKFKKIIVVVTDSMGIGEMTDADKYNDTGANTFGHIANDGDFFVPTLAALGIGNICKNKNVLPVGPQGVVMRMNEASTGKDTLTGHFEIMGLLVTKPYPSFTNTGFPKELIQMIEEYSNRKVIGNYSASGTEIMKDLGERQLVTGELIVYTSADSVLQIAANEEIIPLQELYDICSYVRKITIENPLWQVGRIIARPFVGNSKETFKRTTNRHDYALKPFDKTVLDYLKEAQFTVSAIGKINDIFDGEGITKTSRSTSNHEGMLLTIEEAKKNFTGLVFTNLVDFDALYGHRRDLQGYKKAIIEFDQDLKLLLETIDDQTLVLVVADHGNDPVHHGTDHTREMVPLICYHNHIKGKVLKDQPNFATVGATIAENFGVKLPKIGKSILGDL